MEASQELEDATETTGEFLSCQTEANPDFLKYNVWLKRILTYCRQKKKPFTILKRYYLTWIQVEISGLFNLSVILKGGLP